VPPRSPACILIGCAISGDRNVIKKEAEEVLQCKDFTRELQCMWNGTYKNKVIRAITGTSGTSSK